MAEQKNRFKAALMVGLVLALLTTLFGLLAGPPVAAESGPIQPLARAAGQTLTRQQQQAQALALDSAPVQRYVEGARAEVFAILPFRDPFVPAYDACRDGSCYQVDIFDFDQAATITAIAHVAGDRVLDAWLVPGSYPLIPPALYQRAVEIVRNDPDVQAALGYRPTPEQTRLMDADDPETVCTNGRLCAGATFMTDSGAVWVLVDLHEERVERLWWEDKPYDLVSNQIDPKPERVPEDCGVTIHVSRDGWKLNYRTTPSDGLEVTNVTFNMGGVDHEVATRLKLVEWHARYPGGGGYRDYIGCNSGGGGFPIYPFGNTQIRDLYDETNQVIGFVVVQDFRMSNWTASCNYRYDQHFEFYTDGRYRVKTGAYGRGCGNSQLSEATYRPVMRLDVAVLGDDNDTFSIWNGSQWNNQTVEGWWLQSGPYTAEGYRYRVLDQSGFGYYIAPGQGQFDDYGTGDNAYIYLTLHRASEGDGDMGALPNTGCCYTDHRQGPHTWVDGENVFRQNIVLWYVPASETITTWAVNNGYGERQYCWTDNASTTWPCFAGPMFVPNTPEVCSPLDFNCSLTIDSNDIATLANHWGCTAGEPDSCYEARFDLNGDQTIDVIDVLLVARRWGCFLGQMCYNP
jgi:hypothetical protein